MGSTVWAAAEALKAAGCAVKSVRIPALERDFDLDVSHYVNEMKPGMVQIASEQPDEMIFKNARGMLNILETPMPDFVDAEQAIDRLKDGFAEYFQKYDALVCPVIPVPSHGHTIEELTIDGQTASNFNICSTTTPFTLTGLSGLSIPFGASHKGMPIDVQLVSSWYAESTVLHLPSVLEKVSPVKEFHPNI